MDNFNNQNNYSENNQSFSTQNANQQAQYPQPNQYAQQGQYNQYGQPNQYAQQGQYNQYGQPNQYAQQGQYNQYGQPNQYAQQGQYNQYGQPMYNQYNRTTLKTNRSLVKYIFLSLITFGIYGIVVFCGIPDDLNFVATRYDGKRTMPFLLLAFIFSWLTFGIAVPVWYHRMSNRLGAELTRRGIAYSVSAADFWLWNVLGTLIIVGPFIYMHKLLKGMNLICADFNQKGC